MEQEKKMQKRITNPLTILILSLLVLTTFPVTNIIATEVTIYVDDDNTSGPWDGSEDHPYQTIQDGINASNSSDIIYVKSGSYTENIIITQDITLTGENKETTIIDGGNSGHVIYANGTALTKIDVHISDFTVKNAGGTGNDCIALSYIHNSAITNNKIMDSDKSDGIQLDHCTGVTINDNEIKNNEGAGIFLTLSDSNIIHDNTIQNNLRGIYIYYSSNTNEIYDNNIVDNSQYGVYIRQSQNNLFYRNKFINTENQNAYDAGGNHWNTSNEGNYWGDYPGVDINPQDGIGDTPYEKIIENGKDYYPLGYFGPTAEILSIAPNPAITGQTISFSGKGIDPDGDIIAYKWESDKDGDLSSLKEFTYSGLSVGSHLIKFKVQDDDNKWSSYATETVIVNTQSSQMNQRPSATIESITPNPAIQGETISFLGTGVDKDGEIIGWDWRSSINGVLSTQSLFNTTDLSVGVHTIYFKVQDDDNEWSYQNAATLTIIQNRGSTTGSLIANPGGPYSGQTNEVILFDASSSYNTDSIVSYHWDFGDETTGTGVTTTHSYANPGNFTITLRVTDNEGNTSTAVTYALIIQSTSQNGETGGFLGLEIELPFPLIVGIEVVIIIAVIGLLLYWVKRK